MKIRKSDRVPDIVIKKKGPTPNIVYDTYWKFAAERQAIFFRRLSRNLPPWTNDIILRYFKFTNAYRVADRVSQYLVKEVIYKGDPAPREVLFRILLFKIFNKIETWELIIKHIGSISWSTYDFRVYNGILEKAKVAGESIYSGAYIMASGISAFGHKFKHQNHLKLIEQMVRSPLYEKIQSLRRMHDLFDILKGQPTIGSFLAYQLAIDINYSQLTNFSEMDFVKAGPGARDGIKKCFSDLGDYSEEDAIRMMADNQDKEFARLGINFQSLWGRPLQLIDCQNLFCEVDKYSRVAHPQISGISDRRRIKQKFSPTSLIPIDYYFPPKWNILVENRESLLQNNG
jgi:hypothetical protein